MPRPSQSFHHLELVSVDLMVFVRLHLDGVWEAKIPDVSAHEYFGSSKEEAIKNAVDGIVLRRKNSWDKRIVAELEAEVKAKRRIQVEQQLAKEEQGSR